MIEYVLLVLGIVLLILGGDYFVKGASSLARKWGVSSLVIGLTVVAFGTSLPELFVNIFAAVQGKPDVGLGNVVGSNISNILLILGVSVLFSSRLQVKFSTIWREIPYSFFAAVVLLLVSLGGGIISRYDGIILLVFFLVFLYYVWGLIRSQKVQGADEYVEMVPVRKFGNLKIALFLLGGIVGLYLGGRWTVDGAVVIARSAGMSEFAISATIIAVGTSLPELVTSVIAARKNEVDLAVGNIIGSNIFNILFILGVSSVILPIPVASTLLFDLGFLIGITGLLFLFIFLGKKGELKRWEGAVFMLLYAIYLLHIFLK